MEALSLSPPNHFATFTLCTAAVSCMFTSSLLRSQLFKGHRIAIVTHTEHGYREVRAGKVDQKGKIVQRRAGMTFDRWHGPSSHVLQRFRELESEKSIILSSSHFRLTLPVEHKHDSWYQEEEDAAPDAEIAAYQDERRLTADANPLQFWRCNSTRYPVLSRMVGSTP
jgi:hypothetical protein